MKWKLVVVQIYLLVNYLRVYLKMTRVGEIKNFKFNFKWGGENPILFYKKPIFPPKLHFLKKNVSMVEG